MIHVYPFIIKNEFTLELLGIFLQMYKDFVKNIAQNLYNCLLSLNTYRNIKTNSKHVQKKPRVRYIYIEKNIHNCENKL